MTATKDLLSQDVPVNLLNTLNEMIEKIDPKELDSESLDTLYNTSLQYRDATNELWRKLWKEKVYRQDNEKTSA